mmetsp:Transcript_47113/g.123627  ORF Transcript_47113/g.123627 Transcript_47113/m.123627 type:complete len:237 (+) Transcript_47113:323-1033(+)
MESHTPCPPGSTYRRWPAGESNSSRTERTHRVVTRWIGCQRSLRHSLVSTEARIAAAHATAVAAAVFASVATTVASTIVSVVKSLADHHAADKPRPSSHGHTTCPVASSVAATSLHDHLLTTISTHHLSGHATLDDDDVRLRWPPVEEATDERKQEEEQQDGRHERASRRVMACADTFPYLVISANAALSRLGDIRRQGAFPDAATCDTRGAHRAAANLAPGAVRVSATAHTRLGG